MSNNYNCNKIIAGIYLSNHNVIFDNVFLNKLNINLIVNASSDIPNNKNIKTIYSNIDDIPKDEDNFYESIDKTINIIYDDYLIGKNILIHCKGEGQKSAIIVACFLLKYYQNFNEYNNVELIVDNIIKFIKHYRECAFDNQHFRNLLINYYRNYC